MARNVILHIGRHKTGTTGIPRFLDSRRAELAEAGFCYPLAGRCRSPERPRESATHPHLARGLSGPRPEVRQKPAALRPAFLAEVAGTHTFILSRGAFQNVPHLDLLAEFLDGFEVVTLCYLREYLAYVTSSYSRIVMGSGLAEDVFLFEGRFAFDIPDFIKRWEGIAQRCVWRLYDRGRLIDGDVIADFIEAADLPLTPGRLPEDPNLSIPGNLLAFKLVFNAVGLHGPVYGAPILALAQAHQRFRGLFYLDRDTQRRLQDGNSCNRDLGDLFGDVPEIDLEKGHRMFDPTCLEQDITAIQTEIVRFERVVSHPIMAALQRGHVVAEGIAA
ncbi:hypothetical protein [Rhodovulum sp. BSW8]|uniref:hypothetical protein n=1 Tax=Rhodovulum sp. BSW8 TaxID=2259645 RepID=UPI00140392B0|nr:hypothetical protein [Rhodovulum sp. BSW8]